MYCTTAGGLGKHAGLALYEPTRRGNVMTDRCIGGASNRFLDWVIAGVASGRIKEAHLEKNLRTLIAERTAIVYRVAAHVPLRLNGGAR